MIDWDTTGDDMVLKRGFPADHTAILRYEKVAAPYVVSASTGFLSGELSLAIKWIFNAFFK